VTALVLGTLPVKVTDGQRPLIPDPALLRELSAAVETGWGQASLVPLLAPSRADDTRFLSWYRRWERLSSTPSAAAATLRWAMEFDLGPVPVLGVPCRHAGLPHLAWATRLRALGHRDVGRQH
jgi:hypothetical protein